MSMGTIAKCKQKPGWTICAGNLNASWYLYIQDIHFSTSESDAFRLIEMSSVNDVRRNDITRLYKQKDTLLPRL